MWKTIPRTGGFFGESVSLGMYCRVDVDYASGHISLLGLLKLVFGSISTTL